MDIEARPSAVHKLLSYGMSAVMVIAFAPAIAGAVSPNRAYAAKAKAPARAKIVRMTSVKAGQATVKVAKIKGTKGYQYRIATNKKLTKNSKSAKSSKTSLTFKGLKEGRTYFAKARAYAKIGSKIRYGAWSKAASVKVKEKKVTPASKPVDPHDSGTIDPSKAANSQASITTTLDEANAQNPLDVKTSAYRINVSNNVVYKTVSGTKLRMDILMPTKTGRTEQNPTVVFVPGGGFTKADTTKNLVQRMALAEAGFTVASVQHRVVPQAQFPAPIQDLKSAVRFLKANAAQYGVNPEQVAAMGNSSGGYMATMLGVTGNTKTITWNGKKVALDQGNDLDQSSAVNAVIDLYGVSDLSIIGAGLDDDLEQGHHSASTTEAMFLNGTAFGNNKGASVFDTPEKAAVASPFTYIDKNDPEFLIMHGDKDTLVSPVASYELYKHLKNAGVGVQRYTIAGSGHGGWRFDQPEALDKMVGFMQKYATKDIVESTGSVDTSQACTAQTKTASLAEATSQNVLKIDEQKNYSITNAEDIVYKTYGNGDMNLKMDVLVPSKARGEKHPLVVFIGGGGFTGVNVKGNLNQRIAFARAGYVVASIQHQVVPNAQFPTPLQDIRAGVRYLMAHADTYGIDTGKILAAGNSAGGYMATMLGVTANNKTIEWDGKKVALDKGDNLDQQIHIDGVLDLYGVSDLTIIGAGLEEGLEQGHHSPAATEAMLINGTAFGGNKGASVFDTPERAAAASPFTYIDKNDPQFVIMSGSEDTLVSPVATMELYKHLTKAGVKASRYTIVGAGHGGILYDQPETVGIMTDFVKTVLG